MAGSVQKDLRRDPVSGERLWRGTWLYVLDLPVGADGKRRQKKRRGFATKTLALDALAAATAQLDGVEKPAPSQEPVSSAEPESPNGSSLSVAEYLEAWLEDVRLSLSVTGWRNYRTVMRAYVVPWLGSRHLSDITEDDLSRLYRVLLARGSHRRCRGCDVSQCEAGRPLSATSVRLVHRILHKALFDGRRLVPVNPATGARRPKRGHRVMDVWSDTEAAANLQALRGDRLYAAWFLGVVCGLRRGELAGLRWSCLDLTRGVLSVQSQRTTADWEVVEKDPKGTSRRMVSLGPATIAVLTEHRERQKAEWRDAGREWSQAGYVFVTEAGEPFHPAALTRRFQTLCRSVGARVIRLHETRHTSATLAFAANVHPKVVQERLGHSSVQITLDTYSHRIPSMQRDAAGAIETFVTGDPTTGSEDSGDGS